MLLFHETDYRFISKVSAGFIIHMSPFIRSVSGAVFWRVDNKNYSIKVVTNRAETLEPDSSSTGVSV